MHRSIRDAYNEDCIEQEVITAGKPQVILSVGSVEEAMGAQEKIERKGGMRLTDAMRCSIAEKVFDFKFKKSGDKLDALELKLSHRAMVACFGTENLEMLAKLGPPYAFMAHDVHGDALTGEELAKWKGHKIAFRVGELGHQYTMRVKDPVCSVLRDSYSSHKRCTIKAGKLADDIIAWHEACQDWTKEKREVEIKIFGVLRAVTTFNSLQKTWPDGERFWKHLPVDFPFRNQVPALKVSELNDALGIAE